MPVSKKLTSFESEAQMANIKNELENMVQSANYNTQPSFSANTDRYPDNLIPFIDKHLDYLKSHKGLDPGQYISNLRLMTRIKIAAA